MNILILSKYERNGASSRVRTYQYIDELQTHNTNLKFKISPLFSNTYVKNLYSRKNNFTEILKSYLRRLLIFIFISKKYDFIYIEKEVFPFLSSVFEIILKKRGFKYIVDYDDAVFHNYDKHQLWIIRFLFSSKVSRIIKNSYKTVTGSKYLYNYATNFSKHIELIPSTVSLEKYQNVVPQSSNQKIIIGWIGTPKTSKFLIPYLDLFNELQKNRNVEFRFIGLSTNFFNKKYNFKYVKWQEQSEAHDLNEIDIGIMPLDEDEFSKGKCAYKLIQFMALKKPVVASDVGANNYVVKHEVSGFLAANNAQWKEYLIKLIEDENLRQSLGIHGFESFKKDYSLESQLTNFVNLFR